MTDKQPLNGYLDRMRRNISSLDESIEDVRKTPEGEKAAEKRARLKLLRDLVELQNASLLAVKTHLLGRAETGTPVEPEDYYAKNPEVEFERAFQRFLEPWTQEDLKLKCADCGVESEDVSYRSFERKVPFEIGDFKSTTTETYNVDLCEKCYDKRTASSGEEKPNVGS